MPIRRVSLQAKPSGVLALLLAFAAITAVVGISSLAGVERGAERCTHEEQAPGGSRSEAAPLPHP
jgi:hypothetical protein